MSTVDPSNEKPPSTIGQASTVSAPTVQAAATSKAKDAKDSSTQSEKKKPKRKKPSNTKSSAQTSANIFLQKLIRERELRKHDAAWLSTSPDPISREDHDNSSVSSPSFLQNDADIVMNALLKNGISSPEDVTAEAFDCLLEHARKYAMELITDASDYANHSHGSEQISPADLQLAKEMKDDAKDWKGRYNIDSLAAMARETNKIILPPIPFDCYNGVVLPPMEYTLLGRSYDVVLSKRNRGASMDGVDQQNMSLELIEKDTVGQPSYGAKRGQKQIQIKLIETRKDNESRL